MDCPRLTYDTVTWELQKFPCADWFSLEDCDLTKDTKPSKFSADIRYNLVLRKFYRDMGIPLTEGQPRGICSFMSVQIDVDWSVAIYIRGLTSQSQMLYL